jgi:hypothetical protein
MDTTLGVIIIMVIVTAMTAMILWCKWVIEKISKLDDKSARGIVRSIHHER